MNENKIFDLCLITFIMLMLCFRGYSQSTEKTQVFKGKVIDGQTNETIPFATLQIEGTTSGTSSNTDGYFILRTSMSDPTILVSSVGYKTERLQLKPGNLKPLTIRLIAEIKELDAIVVKPDRKRYKNRNNPAMDVMEKVISNKSNNRIIPDHDYSYEKYDKILFGLSNLTPEFKEKRSKGKYQFVFENTDTSLLQGKEVLPVYLKETLSDVVYLNAANKESEITKADKSVSFEGYLDNQGITEYLEFLYQNINIYDNNLTFLTNPFLSPVATTAPAFYKYYIIDTSIIAGKEYLKMFFAPRNKTDMLFQGYLYVTLDSSYAIKKADMSVNKDINLNWVKQASIIQEFENAPDFGWYITRNEIKIDFGIANNGMGMLGQRTAFYRHYGFDTIETKDAVRAIPANEYRKADTKTDEYWEQNRPFDLTASEKNTYVNMDSIQRIPSFRRTMNFALFILYGYKDAGYFEVGPINTFFSYNPIEGTRLKFGGRTTPMLSKKIFFENYLAYGLKDEKWKYYIGTTLSLTPKTIYEFPVKYLKVSYQYDSKIPGQMLRFVQEDNILLSFKRGVNDKRFFNKTLKIEHLNEFDNHFSYTLGYEFSHVEPAGTLCFNYIDYSLQQNDKSTINTSELFLRLRYAPHEQFYQGKTYRTPIKNNYPVFELQYNLGNDVLGSDYNYHRLALSFDKRFDVSVLGYTTIHFEAGKIFGRVPYPLLILHRANQTYSYQLLSYNLMNFLEFVSDQYVGLNIDHSFNGFFFNKIPVIKKLKLREVLTCKVLYGNITKNNNPDYHSDLFKFPVEPDGTPITYSLGEKPYIEASAGIGNIFKLFRIDLVKRYTYLDHPHVTGTGLRVRFKVDF